MENNENKPMPEDPKPADEVQLNIETVIPETEKDVVVPDEDLTSEQSKEPEKPTDREESEDSATSVEENPASDELNKDDGQSDDARDDVETVSP